MFHPGSPMCQLRSSRSLLLPLLCSDLYCASVIASSTWGCSSLKEVQEGKSIAGGNNLCFFPSRQDQCANFVPAVASHRLRLRQRSQSSDSSRSRNSDRRRPCSQRESCSTSGAPFPSEVGEGGVAHERVLIVPARPCSLPTPDL